MKNELMVGWASGILAGTWYNYIFPPRNIYYPLTFTLFAIAMLIIILKVEQGGKNERRISR
jgi:hypothetical protein